MGNPNFLSANAAGIELMPGVNDDAVGYDVNRIIQALNGTNIVPITTGNLTVNGILNVLSGPSTMIGPLTVSGGTVSELALSNAGEVIRIGGVGGGRLQMGSAAGNTWEIDNSSGTFRIYQPGTLYASLTTSLFNVIPALTVGGLITASNGITVTTGGETISAGDLTVSGGNIFGPANFQISSTGGDIYVQANSGNSVILRPTRGSGTGQAILGGSGQFTTANFIAVPPSSGASLITSSYGTLPVKIADQVLTGNPTSVTINVASGLYRAMEVVIGGAMTNAASAQGLLVQVNSDSGANYDYSIKFITGTGVTWSDASSSGATSWNVGIPVATTGQNSPGQGSFLVTNTDNGVGRYKGFITRSWAMLGTLSSANMQIEIAGGQWRNSAASISSFTFTLTGGNSFNDGRIIIYGYP